jgi:hypothetical protein
MYTYRYTINEAHFYFLQVVIWIMAKAGTVSRALAERFFFELFGDNSIS